MKATQSTFAGIAPKAARKALVFFFCGPDESGAWAAMEKIRTLLPDAGERIELSGAELKRDPVLLSDEARSTSLFGGTRHILVRAQGEEAHDALKILLESEGEPCPVLVVATSATDKSRTAKLLTDRDDALVAMFYPPDVRTVTEAVRDMAGAAGLRLSGDLAERIARASKLDVRLAQTEVTKLALYLDASAQATRAVEAADINAIGAVSEDDGFMSLVDAVLSGRKDSLASEFKRMHDLALNPVGLLLAFERRVAQLVQLTARLGPRGDIAGLLDIEMRARRVFLRDKKALSEQLRIWRGPRLERLARRMIELHRALMENSQSAELLLAQGLAEISRAARPGK